MKWVRFTTAIVATFIASSLAQATPHHRHNVTYADGRVVGGRPSGCPIRYCGCGTSLHIFGRIIKDLNLAANWLRKFPRAAPAPGMVAARSGHVFAVESVNADGTVVAYDPNSGGGMTRIHTMSLSGYRVVDPRGARVATNFTPASY